MAERRGVHGADHRHVDRQQLLEQAFTVMPSSPAQDDGLVLGVVVGE
jgi:hypothetical protein